MATIKNIVKLDRSAKLEATDDLLRNFSIRMKPFWLDVLSKKAYAMSLQRKQKIKAADLIREAVFQCWIRD